jgi:signal transduction histidine kinase
VRQVTKAAHDIQAGDLNRRLPIPAACDEIGEMVREMNGMIERLDAAFTAQRKFILDVTHELKTPVSILLAEAQVLGRTSPENAPERYEAFVQSVEEETRRLGQLLESFLTLARASHGETYVAESLVSVNEVVVEAAGRWEQVGALMGTRVKLILDEGDEDGNETNIRGDHELLATMLENLLCAVSEQSGPKRVLEVTVGRDYHRAVVSVRALDPETMRPASTRLIRHRSHELRMAIVEGIVQLHAGEVQTSGTCAKVSLPGVAAAIAARA